MYMYIKQGCNIPATCTWSHTNKYRPILTCTCKQHWISGRYMYNACVKGPSLTCEYTVVSAYTILRALHTYMYMYSCTEWSAYHVKGEERGAWQRHRSGTHVLGERGKCQRMEEKEGAMRRQEDEGVSSYHCQVTRSALERTREGEPGTCMSGWWGSHGRRRGGHPLPLDGVRGR